MKTRIYASQPALGLITSLCGALNHGFFSDLSECPSGIEGRRSTCLKSEALGIIAVAAGKTYQITTA